MQTDPFVGALQDALGPAYQLGRELGGGGMSRVFVARDVTLQRDVVVKVLAPELAQELSVERFAREIALAAALQHANIVPLLAAGATKDKLPYYLMPYVDGESLRHRVETRGALPVPEVQQVLHDVLRALAWAHARGVVHRDIKPDNVMLAGGAALVTDFGIAKAMSSARQDAARDDTLTRVGTSIGTPNYMAPEQGAGDPSADHRADLYALGAMTYELLTGAPPFGDRPSHAQLIAHLTEAPVPVSTRRPDVPAGLAALVMQCLEKDPADRPATAEAAMAMLARRDEDAVTGTRTAERPAATGAAPRSRRGLLVGVIGSVAALAVAGAVWLQRGGGGADAPTDTVLAVMPFTVRDAPLQVWREGLVDVLSRSLDGVSTLRIASPSASIAKAGARADAEAAAVLAGELGATLVLFGDLSQMGADSVHLRAALYDTRLSKSRAEFDVRGSAQRIDALADSLALNVLRELGAAGTLAGGKLPSLGTSSLVALKAFVEGQRHYRGGRVDSSRAAFMAAVRADSTFSLAWRGVAALFIRQGREADPEAQNALDRAIRHKSGLSARDSLLLLGDSLRLAISRRTPGTPDATSPVTEVTRLLATLGTATTRYPDDAELWMELGDAGFHYGGYASVPERQIADQFARAVALDSMLSVPHLHGFDLALRAGDHATAGAKIGQFARLSTGTGALYYTVLSELLTQAPAISSSAARVLDSLDARYAATALQTLSPMPDTVGSTAALQGFIQTQLLPKTKGDTAAFVKAALSYASFMRGRFREGLAVQPAPLSVRIDLAELGAVPADSVLADVQRLVRGDPDNAVRAWPLLVARRDTLTLRLLADSLVRRDAERAAATPGAAVVKREPVLRAAVMLARGDSAAALQQLLALPMRQCGGVPCGAYPMAGLLAAAGRDAEAARVLDRWLPQVVTSLHYPRYLLLRAQLAERLGDNAAAAEWAHRIVARWRDGDPEAQATVNAAKAIAQRTRRGG